MSGGDMVHSEPSDPKLERSNSALPVAPTCEFGNASSCLVAVILCCKETAELAAAVLPATPAVFGDHWFYLARGKTPAERFVDPVSGETIVEIREATREFAETGASEIEIGELLRAVGRLAAHCLGKRHCDGVIDGDDESLIRSLDDVANPRLVDRIVLWLLEHPSSGTICDV
jgi:hypothetical protein